MKKQKSFLFSLLLVVALVLALGIVFWFSNDTSNIVGGWEIDVPVIDPYSAEEDSSGRVQFYFYDDLTGEEITTSLGKTTQRNFTYQISDDELCITFESGTVWKFPYSLKKNTLVLKQNSASITYHRITND